MWELLDNLYNLTFTHLEHKIKHAKIGERREEIKDIIVDTADKIYDSALEILSEAERKIDSIVVDEEYKESERVENRKDFNVFMLKK